MPSNYTPYYTGGWQSGEGGNTPITPAALNNMESGIAAANYLIYNNGGSSSQLFGLAADVVNSASGLNGHRILLMVNNAGLLVYDQTASQTVWSMAFPLGVTAGGTGADTSAGARANLGAVALSDVIAASGTKDFGTIPANGQLNATISIGATQPSTNYMILTEALTGNVTVGIQQKTTTQFVMYVRNVSSSDANGTIKWSLVRLP